MRNYSSPMGKSQTPVSTALDTYDVQSEEENLPPRKGNKRTFKSPYQLEALERFYREHMYPSESMKAQLASNLGLSDKQIQSWFCHRRSKDKKLLEDTEYGITKNDLQSSVNDCGSGVKHDSCSSSKQEEHLYDFREVESHRFHSQAYLDSGSDLRERYLLAGNYSVVDDTPSESSSASQDKRTHSINQYSRRNLSYATMNDEYQYMQPTPGKGSITVSEEPCVDGTYEHPSVVTVKLKLGKMYRMDGPLLGFEFQSLPPCAFDPLPSDQLNEPYYVGDSIPQNSQNAPRLRNYSNVCRRFGKNWNVLHSNNSTLRESSCRWVQPSHDSPTWGPSRANQHNQLSKMHLQMDEYSDSEASEFISNESETMSSHGKKSKSFPSSNDQKMPCKDSSIKKPSFGKILYGKRGQQTSFPYEQVNSSIGEAEVDSSRMQKKAKMSSRWSNNKEGCLNISSASIVRGKRTGGKIWMPDDTSNYGAAFSSQMLKPLKGSPTDITSSSTDGSEATGGEIQIDFIIE